jgi:hypothetical protein
MTMNLRLGFYFHVPAIAREEGIYMPGFQGRFVESLASHCEQVTCFLHSPRANELESMDHRITSSNVKLFDIGPHVSTMGRVLNWKRFTRPLRLHARDLDAVLVRGPSPLLPAMANATSLPVALLLVGDYTTGINDLPQPIWRRELIRLWSYWNKSQQNQIVRRSLTFVNSRILYDELKGRAPNLHETRTTTLNSDDFFGRSDTCQSAPCRLLYVGRMDRTKGLLQIVEAIALLTARGENVTLDLVGWATPKDPILEEVAALAGSRGIGERIKYHGPRPLGPELFDFYKKSDIFVTASWASEGFPRTILEAMAHSLPVVATRVGSIPAFIEGAAELIQPRDVPALADAISRILHTPEWRRQLMLRGFELSKNNTLEVQVGEMVGTIKKWVGGVA